MKNLILIAGMTFCFSAIGQQKLTKTFYDARQTKIKEEYHTANGVKNGTYKEFSEYGGVLRQGTYKNDIRVGTWIITDLKGISSDTENFNMSGEMEGKWIKHCPFNRRIKLVEGYYTAGKRNGIWSEYECESDPLTTKQILKSKETYSAGEVNGECEYFSNGERRTGLIKKGQKTGEWKEYNQSGKMAITFYYTGNTFGPYSLKNVIVYYNNGKIAAKRNALHNYQDVMQAKLGEELYYDTTGVLEAKIVWNKDSITDHYNDAYFSGSYEEYYPSLKLGIKGTLRFERGREFFVGEKIAYYENGNKKSEGKYDRNGYLITGTYIEYFETGEPNEKSRK